LDRDDEKEVS